MHRGTCIILGGPREYMQGVCEICAQNRFREPSGLLVECLTRDRGAAGSFLSGVTALRKTRPCFTNKHNIIGSILLQHGGSMISGKGVHIYKGVCLRVALLILSHFHKYPMAMK